MTSLVSADQLVVSQKPKLVELANEYMVRAPDGAELGYVREEAQGKARKVLRFVSDLDQFLTHRLSVYDAGHHRVLRLTRPAKIVKSKFNIEDGDGRKVGDIVQNNTFGKISFDLVGTTGEHLGRIKAQNWRAWDFSIVDYTDREIGRIDKKFVGVMKSTFTTADNYVVDIAPSVIGDLRLLVIAAAFAVDTALKQDDRGPSVTGLLADRT